VAFPRRALRANPLRCWVATGEPEGRKRERISFISSPHLPLLNARQPQPSNWIPKSSWPPNLSDEKAIPSGCLRALRAAPTGLSAPKSAVRPEDSLLHEQLATRDTCRWTDKQPGGNILSGCTSGWLRSSELVGGLFQQNFSQLRFEKERKKAEEEELISAAFFFFFFCNLSETRDGPSSAAACLISSGTFASSKR